jgi:DNA-binding NarL/FixJ family response regulator
MSNGIAIADDSATARKVIRVYLNQRNCEICGEAIDGVDALEKATEREPALILLRPPDASHERCGSGIRAERPDAQCADSAPYVV